MRLIIIAGMAFLLAACASVGALPELQPPNYEKYGVTRLDVREIQIVNSYIPPMQAPHVEQQFVVPPYVVVRDWAGRRFQAVGSIGVAKIIIENASVVQKDIKSGNDNAFANMFNDTVDKQYDMLVQVRIEITSPKYENTPFAAVKVIRTMQTKESIALSARDEGWHNMNLAMLDELNRLMTNSVKNKLGGVVR